MIQALKSLDRRAFGVLFAGGLLGVLAVLPLMAELVAIIPPHPANVPLPMPAIVLLALVQNGLLLAVTIAVGMTLAPRVGLTMPLVEAWAAGRETPRYASTALVALGLGGAAGAVLVLVDVLFFVDSITPSMRAFFEFPLWKRLLAGVVYGGITEELLMRLFLMSLVVRVLGRWWRTPAGRPAAGAFWTCIVFVALLFGLGHLPVTATVAALTPAIVVRALVLNGIAGVVFGWLYWRHGLEAAMLGHMGTHLVMQPGLMLITRVLA